MKNEQPAPYNTQHWTGQISNYLSQDWSLQPSPFAQKAKTFFPATGDILELGAGAGQDGLWFAAQNYHVILSDGTDAAFEAITSRAKANDITGFELAEIEITEPFMAKDESFDVVYAQLVLHYFDDETMQKIMREIERVLKPAGILACMVNSTKDPEYNQQKAQKNGLVEVGLLQKRYFDIQSFGQFTQKFNLLLFDESGRTPKDDNVSNSGMVQFIGTKKVN